MANIVTQVNESVYSIKKWLGVNETEDGETRLKLGEAAKMRNFKITPGGTLQKRPGSFNVAGLLSQYNAKTGDTEYTKEAVGLMAVPFLMYPRIAADSVGNVITEGTKTEINADNAEDGIGLFTEVDGSVRLFKGMTAVKGAGDNVISGGAYVRGTLQSFDSGAENNLSGSVITSGTQDVVTAKELKCVERQNVLCGDEEKQERAFSESAGFVTSDVGGYLEHNGKVWEYYGAKTESYATGKRQRKYKCIRTGHTSYYTYYTQSSETARDAFPVSSENINWALTGYSSYTFNSSTGKFSGSGSSKTLSPGESGTVYVASGSSVTRYVYTAYSYANETGSYIQGFDRTAEGPYTGTSTTYTYSTGDYVSDVVVEDGKRPEADTSSYVTTYTEDGTTYTVMKDGSGEFYAYCESDDETVYYSCTWGFYGYPVTVSADIYTWSFLNTLSESNDTTDRSVRGIWSGFVSGREVLCTASNGHLWELTLTEKGWEKASCGLLSTDSDIHMFGFEGKLYILNGKEYKVWDGGTLEDVEGYRPIIFSEMIPEGSGTELEEVNKLTGARRCWYSPDGTAKTFMLPESGILSLDWVKSLTSGENLSDSEFTADLELGTVTFNSAPEKGVDTLEIAYTAKANFREQVTGMRYSELYNGSQDTRVFIYGDGSNKAFYSGLDYNGVARADYFPDLNEAAVGDSNTPITAMIRHYNKLLCFKLDSAWSIGYDTITLTDGTVTAGFYITPVNRDIGNCAYGAARLVSNRPRTLDGRGVIEWKATNSSGNITGDQRNAQTISQRVDSTIREMELNSAKTFYDKITHEYYIFSGETVLVNNTEADAWYIYKGLSPTCMVNYKDEVYFGTKDGYLRHFSSDYLSDNGEEIDAYWESGAMDFNEDFKRKYSAMLWVGIKPEDCGYLKVTAETDRKTDFAEYSTSTSDAAAIPKMARLKLKAKKFTYYKLIFQNCSSDTAAAVVSVDIRVRGTGYVR